MKTLILALTLFLAGCATKLPVQVRGLEAAEWKPRNCLQCSMMVERAVKKTGANAKWVALPAPPYLNPDKKAMVGHAICVLEHEGKTFAYDSQFGGMTDLRINPVVVFDKRGNFIGDPVEIHKRARPFDFFNKTGFDELGLGIGVRLPASSKAPW